jgi:UDP-N-acetylglucosamine acyltransferase
MIHPTAIIGQGVTLGDGVWVGAYAVIGAPAEIRGRWADGPVTVGDRTVIREAVIVGAGTRIGADCYIMNQTYIAHDCQIGDRGTMAAGVRLAGHVTVGDDANLGMGTVVHQRLSIGAGSMVGMGSVVTKHVGAAEKWYGNPATLRGMNCST